MSTDRPSPSNAPNERKTRPNHGGMMRGNSLTMPCTSFVISSRSMLKAPPPAAICSNTAPTSGATMARLAGSLTTSYGMNPISARPSNVSW